MIDKNLMNCKLTVSDKELLYKLLYESSDILERLEDCRNKLNDYIKQAYRSTIDKDILLLFDNSKRIAKKGAVVRLDAVDFGLGDNINYYPNELWPREGYIPKKHSTVSGIYSTTLTGEMPEQSSCYYVTRDLIEKVSDKWKEVLKNTYIEFIKLRYESDNFMCDYITVEEGWYVNKKYFLSINSWGQLEREHPDWFNLLFESRKNSLIQKNIISENPISNKDRLINLKNILEI